MPPRTRSRMELVPSEVAPAVSDDASFQLASSCANGMSKQDLGKELAAAGTWQLDLWKNAVLRLLATPHQRPLAAANALRALGAAGFEARPSCPKQLETLCWLLDVTGSRRAPPGDAVDKGIRWRACAILDGFLRALSSQGFAKLPEELQRCCMSVLLARCSDRCADVRHVASEALEALGCSTDKETLEVLRQRALNDRNECVRAACASAIIAQGDHEHDWLDLEIITTASLDMAPRVRRRLLTHLARLDRWKGRASLQTAWREAVLRGLEDRVRSVRLAAVRCFVADVQQLGDRALLLDDAELTAGSTMRMVNGIVAVVNQPNGLFEEIEEGSSSRALRQLLHCFDPVKSIEIASSPDATMGQVLWARITVTLGTLLGDAPNAGHMVAEMQDCMSMLQGCNPEHLAQVHFKLCQWLNCALVCQMPPASPGRHALAHAAGAALQVSSVDFASTALLEDGVFPGSLLGDEWPRERPSFELAILLLRRVAAEGAASAEGKQAAAVTEVWFSNFAAAIFHSLKQVQDEAEQVLLEREDEVEQIRQDLEDRRWAQASFAQKALDCESKNEKALEEKHAEIEAAREQRNHCCLRALLLATGWLRYSRCPLQRDSKQSQLLDMVLLPVVQSKQPLNNQVAAIHGIAIYASKSQEHALAHWDFFRGLLEAQSELGELASLRLAELSVHFICDVLLLYPSALEPKREQACLALARLLISLEEKNAKPGRKALHHLRAALWDRICCVALRGSLEGAAGAWLLGKALEVCCSRFPSNENDGKLQLQRPTKRRRIEEAYTSLGQMEVSPAEEGDLVHRDDLGSVRLHTRRAVLCTRLLRFFATLPLISAGHAALLVQAMEAFLAARLYMSGAGGSTRSATASRAVRLVQVRLGRAKDSLAAEGCEVAQLQLYVIRSVAAAMLSAPQAQVKGLADALGAAILAAAGGGPCFSWAGERAEMLRDATRSLLREWSPATTAKSVAMLLEEIYTPGRVSVGLGREFAQEALDKAADFRHDLAALGLSMPNPGVSLSKKSSYIPSRGIGYWQKPEPKPEASATKSKPEPVGPKEDPEEWEEPSVELVSRWEILDHDTRLALVPRGSSLTMGRHNSCDICIDDLAVSKRHCIITSLTGSKIDSLVLRDLSSNGTFVNGVHLKSGEELGLSDGDRITLASRESQAFEVRLCQIELKKVNVEKVKAQMESKKEVKAEAEETLNDTKEKKAEDIPNEKKHEEKSRQKRALKESFPLRRLRRKTKDPTWQAISQEKLETLPPAPPPAMAEREPEEDSEDDAQSTATVKSPSKVARVVHRSKVGQSRLVDLTSGEVHRLPEDGLVSVGRRPDCEVVIPRSVVSGRHCVLLCSEGHVQVEDVSANGTFVNETQVPKGFSLPQHVLLHDGDHIFLAHRDGPSLLFLSGEAGDEVL